TRSTRSLFLPTSCSRPDRPECRPGSLISGRPGVKKQRALFPGESRIARNEAGVCPWCAGFAGSPCGVVPGGLGLLAHAVASERCLERRRATVFTQPTQKPKRRIRLHGDSRPVLFSDHISSQRRDSVLVVGAS